MKNLLAILVLTGLIACGIDKGVDTSYDDTSGQHNKKVEKLINEYAPIEGIYKGTFSSSEKGNTRPFALSVYTVEVSQGVDSQGKSRMYPELRARAYFLDYVDPIEKYELAVSYEPETGSIKLVSRAGGQQGSVPLDSFVSITGKVSGENVQLELVQFGGSFGKFAGVKIGKLGVAPEEGAERDFYDRHYIWLSSIAGAYKGKLTRPNGKVDDVALTVFIALEKSGFNDYGQPIFAPVLKAQFSIGGPGDISYFLEGRYYERQNNIVFSSKGDTASVPGGYFLLLDGSYNEVSKEGSTEKIRKIEGFATNRNGALGTFKVLAQ
jgi:hypothetical protein